MSLSYCKTTSINDFQIKRLALMFSVKGHFLLSADMLMPFICCCVYLYSKITRLF